MELGTYVVVFSILAILSLVVFLSEAYLLMWKNSKIGVIGYLTGDESNTVSQIDESFFWIGFALTIGATAAALNSTYEYFKKEDAKALAPTNTTPTNTTPP